VTPSYNQHRFLSQSIDSVLNQTHANFKLCIINDYIGKPHSDRAQEEIESLVKEKSDERLQLSHNISNMGIPASRNLAIRQLINERVEYIFFLDHDDIWHDPNKIKKQLEVLRE
jgi:teichuronic acid biosynthesis glycosyltransferase TuaG